MKTLSEQIAVMTHAESGGAIIVKNTDGTMNHIQLDPDTLTFNWNEFDYDIHNVPVDFWYKITDVSGGAITFPDQASFDADITPCESEGHCYTLGQTEIDCLIDNNMLPGE